MNNGTIPNFIKVWWSTNRQNNMAMVLDVKKYDGKFKEFYTHWLTLEAPNTLARELVIPWKMETQND